MNSEIGPSSESEVAWAAGLYEGEGTIVAARRRNRFYPRIQVYSSDLDVVTRWQKIMGGNVYRRNPNPQALGTKTGYYVELSGPKVREALLLMEPWLGQRRQEQISDVMDKVSANPPLGYHTGWDTRRKLYGPTGRRDGQQGDTRL